MKKVETSKGSFVAKVYEHKGHSLPYQILYPNNFKPSNSYPVLFFLHGSGERGNDNELQLTHGAQLFLDSIDKYPAIIMFPQCAEGDWWGNKAYIKGNLLEAEDTLNPLNNIDKSMLALEALIDSFVATKIVDNTRIYVAGLSMGGMGAAHLMAKYPSRFAAGVVICGIAPLAYSEELSRTPTSIYHGEADDAVDVQYGLSYFEAISHKNDNHRLKVYPGVGHLSWFNAFAEPDFLKWIFDKSKTRVEK